MRDEHCMLSLSSMWPGAGVLADLPEAGVLHHALEER